MTSSKSDLTLSDQTPRLLDRSGKAAGGFLTDQELDELILLAQLMAHRPPEGWRRQTRRRHAFGLNSTIYEHAGDGKTVWCFDGANAPGQILAIPCRRLFGYRLGSLAAEPPPSVVLGMSAGGGKASWIASVLSARSVTFNAGRTRFSLRNDGSLQTNIAISRDPFGDPWNGLYGMPLPGRYVLLPRPRGFISHSMAAILEALRRARHR